MVRLVVLALAVLAVGALASQRAQAFTHEWSCNAAEYNPCYDNQGQQYVSWAALAARMVTYSNVICAKSITSSNNVRSNTCSSGTIDITCYTYHLPESWAYVYWGHAGGTIRFIEGRAHQTYCD
jgi:hypothetical protein